MRKISVLLLSIIVLVACESNQVKKIDRQKFMYGERVYLGYCKDCHGENGEGFKSLYPPLANSDYLKADIKRAICIARYGHKGPITVNGKEYTLEMPPNDELNPEKITDVMNYILNSWGYNEGVIELDTVQSILKECKP